MKIDGITLFQMIKNGEIKDGTKIRELYMNVPTSHIIYYKNKEIGWNPGDFLVSDLYNDDYTFEILENKTEKIEPLKPISLEEFKSMNAAERYHATIIEYDKIEELRNAINYLLEKSK